MSFSTYIINGESVKLVTRLKLRVFLYIKTFYHGLLKHKIKGNTFL